MRPTIATATLAVALLLASLAVLWGLVAVASLGFPGPSGEWAAVYVLAAWVVNVPIGLFALTASLAVKSPPPRLRKLCAGVALCALCLPLVASAIWHRRRHPAFPSRPAAVSRIAPPHCPDPAGHSPSRFHLPGLA